MIERTAVGWEAKALHGDFAAFAEAHFESLIRLKSTAEGTVDAQSNPATDGS